MRISDWSSDVCSSDLVPFPIDFVGDVPKADENLIGGFRDAGNMIAVREKFVAVVPVSTERSAHPLAADLGVAGDEAVEVHRVVAAETVVLAPAYPPSRSEGHTSELQSLMRISYAVFCLKTTKT